MRPIHVIACALSLGLAGCATPSNRSSQQQPAPHGVVFIENDFAGALAKARAEGKPLFVDAWAPWCHTCRSMQEFVFPDPALAPMADRFVWLSLDTERETSAGFLEKYPVESWPSLYVIDPSNGEVALRWLGSATVPQLVHLLEDGERAVKGGGAGAEGLLVKADRLYGDGQKKEAAAVYGEALARAPADWSRRPRAVESQLFALWGAGQMEDCAKAAVAGLPGMALSPSRANAAAIGLSCVLELPESSPLCNEARGWLSKQVEEAISAATASPKTLEIAADDVSGFFETLHAAREKAQDKKGALEVARRWSAYLDGEAARATTSEQRTVFDAHRLLAYLALDEPARAVPMLEQSQSDFPGDYNPPARLAIVYRAMGRNDAALAANDQALGKVYGPRRIRVLQNRAEILKASGDPAAARASLEEALRTFDSLPKGQQDPRMRQRVQKQIEAN